MDHLLTNASRFSMGKYASNLKIVVIGEVV